MKLTKADREYIRRNFWEDEKHIDQIEQAICKTTFELVDPEEDGSENLRKGTKPDRAIPLARAIAILGREKFLAGMDRSAFHWSACVTADNGMIVYFDSSKFFKEG